MEQFEEIEWTNTWFERQGERPGRTAMLIGDSIMVGTRPFLKELLGDDWSVDLIATSRSITSPLYHAEMEMYLGYGSCAFLFFNFGLHARHLTGEEYGREYDRMLMKLQKLLAGNPGARLAVGLSTPVQEEGGSGKYHPFNAAVKERNEIVKKLAEKYQVALVDNYSLVDGKPDWKLPDGLHYSGAGYRAIAENIRRYMP